MTLLLITIVVFAVTGFEVAAIFEFRKMDKELRRIRRDAKQLKSQLEWLETWLIKERAKG